jgi:hypothetical protein
MSTAAPRSLADQLRSWPDVALAQLLDARADLTVPAPQDSSQLASRAGSRASVFRAMDDLTLLELTVLEALVVLGGRASAERVVAVVAAPEETVREALGLLSARALTWGPDEDLRVVGAVSDTLGTTLSRLGPPVEQLLAAYGPERVARLRTDVYAELGLPRDSAGGDRAADVAGVGAVLAEREHVEQLVARCDEPARMMLEHLDRTGSEGATDQAKKPVSVESARTPVEQLVARGLLVPRDSRHLVVPREVGLALRGGRTTREPVGAPPGLATAARSAALVDRAAAGAALELVHRVELLLDHWGNEPPAALRQGGLAVRDLKATAALLHADERTATLHVEVAAAAGLLATGQTVELDEAWLPTDAFDAWRAGGLAERWARLAAAWLDNERLTGIVGTRVQGKGVNALAPELERRWLPGTRRDALRVVAALPAGTVLAAATGVPSLVAHLRWLRPRRPPARDEAVAWVVEEAGILGVLGLGGASTHGRALVADGPAAAAAALAPLLPPPVDHVVLQADLTAVAPGPLEESLARDLATVAHVESRGGATVYRFTEASVRYAFDVGWSAMEVRDVIARASRTPIPQPLDYLVDDVARTFGTVKVGYAESFVRSDDEAALTALIHDSRAAGLRLRRIAPTVLVSDSPPDVLLPRLRELGVAPVVEGPDGVVRVARRDAHRARTPRRQPAGEAAARTAARSAATVTAIRAGDRVTTSRPGGATVARQSPAAALALLREACETGATVTIGYVDADGAAHERVVDPERVEGGWLRAFDHRSDEVRSFALHRIGAVRYLA